MLLVDRKAAKQAIDIADILILLSTSCYKFYNRIDLECRSIFGKIVDIRRRAESNLMLKRPSISLDEAVNIVSKYDLAKIEVDKMAKYEESISNTNSQSLKAAEAVKSLGNSILKQVNEWLKSKGEKTEVFQFRIEISKELKKLNALMIDMATIKNEINNNFEIVKNFKINLQKFL